MSGYIGPVYIPTPHYAGSQNMGNGADFSGALLIQDPSGTGNTYDTIQSASLGSVTPSDLTCSAPTIAKGNGGPATALVFTLSGGTAGTVYEILFTIQTTGGARPVRPVWVRCQ